MKKKKIGIRFSRRLIVLTIIINTIIICAMATFSVSAYRYVINIEQKNCWNVLEDSATGIDRLISTQVENNFNILRLVSGAMVRENNVGDTEETLDAIRLHMSNVLKMTIFNRIDVLFENGMILQDNDMRVSELDFRALADKGEHISGRIADDLTGKESLAFSVPVFQNQKVIAILRGIIFCEDMPQLFDYQVYDGHGIVCLIDRPSGDFIMDDWHDTLENAYEQPNRKPFPGYENIDPRKEMFEGHTGVFAYESKVNGEPSYMYYRKLESVDWCMMVVAQEEAVFGRMNIVKKMLIYIGIIETFLLITYLLWTMRTLSRLLKKAEESEKQKYIDGLTGLYNRNKYIQKIDDYEKMTVNGIGILFFDLNNLKIVNDKEGHDAGDDLIKSLAEILSKHFGDSAYRIGGDEFVICLANVDEANFAETEQLVRQETEAQQISVSIGSAWRADSRSLKDQIKDADQNMYENKKAYYKKHPEQSPRRK